MNCFIFSSVSLKRRKQYLKKENSDSFQIEQNVLISPKWSKTFAAFFPQEN